MPETKWYPLESNPDVLNDYLAKLGLLFSSGCQFEDVLSMDEEMLQMLSQPVYAFLLLYPVTPENETCVFPSSTSEVAGSDEKVVYTKQTIGNACGTIAVLHALLNNWEVLAPFVEKGSILEEVQKQFAGNPNPDERAAALESNTRLADLHNSMAQQGSTGNADINTEIDFHYTCLVRVGGACWELDGRKPTGKPLFVAPCDDAATFPSVAAGRVMEYMKLNPDRLEFTTIALCQSNPQ